MEQRLPAFDLAVDLEPCRAGWHLGYTVDDEPFYFRRAGRSLPLAYVIGPRPEARRTNLVECGPTEGVWLCEACGMFVATETCHFQDALHPDR